MDTKTILFLFFFLQITQEYIVREKRDGAIKAKPMFTEGLFEGDIKGITNDTIQKLVKRSNTIHLVAALPRQNGVRSGAAVRDLFAVWPNAELFYEISNEFTQNEQKIIKDSLEVYHQKTCVKMIPRTDQPNYISVKKFGEGECWSAVGRRGGAQELSLGKGCIDKGIIIHEFMHALGFFHEQSRWDRDKYIVIHKENILDGQEGNFMKYGLDKLKELNTDYDYKSIMHYQKDAFSKNNLPTIVPIQNVEIGNKLTLSEIDIIELKRLYNCYQIGPTPSPISPVGPTSPKIIQSGIRLLGNNTCHPIYNVTDAEECKKKCEEQVECSGMSFDSNDTYSFGNCFLAKAGYTTENDKSWSSWIKRKIEPGSIQPGLRLYGLYTQFNVTDAEECKQKCEEQIECSGMTFDSSHTYPFGNCFLAKAGYTIEDDKPWSAWAKREVEPGSIQPGFRLYGNYTGYKVNNAEECKKHCEIDNQCYGMTFDSSNSIPLINCFICWANYTVEYDKPWSSWMKGKIQPGIHFAYEKTYRGFSKVNTIMGCIQKCQQDARCRAMNYYDGNKDTDVFGNCFLYDTQVDHGVGDNANIDRWSAWVKGQS